MEVVLVFAVVLLVAVALSHLASRTLLSTAALFLVAGFATGELGLVPVDSGTDGVVLLTELALFAVLFTDAMLLGVRELVSSWRLAGRALVVGMPLVWVLTAGLAVALTTLPVTEALLLAAVLAPTDPVLASAIVGHQHVPYRLRQLLQVESGLNDGLALPVVLVLIAIAGPGDVTGGSLATELGLGILIGIGLPAAILLLLRLPVLRAAEQYEPLVGIAIGLTVLSSAKVFHGNLFLAAFAAGVAVATLAPEIRETFRRVGEPITELLKLAALLVFGALLSAENFGDIGTGDVAFAVLVIVAARPVAILVSLVGSGLPRGERLTAAWFGPKGFASVVYGLLVLHAGLDNGIHLFHVAAIAIALSMLVHSSTDVAIAERFATRVDGEDGDNRDTRTPPADRPDRPVRSADADTGGTS